MHQSDTEDLITKLERLKPKTKPTPQEAFLDGEAAAKNGSFPEDYIGFYNSEDLNNLEYDTLYRTASFLSLKGYAFFIPALLQAALIAKSHQYDAITSLTEATSLVATRSRRQRNEVQAYFESCSANQISVLRETFNYLATSAEDYFLSIHVGLLADYFDSL